MLSVVSSAVPQHDFSSIQFTFPKSIADKVIQWGKEHIPDDDIAPNPHSGKDGREDHIHVTVKFGLHTADPKEVEEIVKDFGLFTLTLDEMSIFSSDEYDVLKIDVKSDKLHELNKLISDKLECTDTHPEYIPHVTIAYVKKGKADDLVGSEDFKGQAVTVSSIEFRGRGENKTSISIKKTSAVT